MAQGCGFVVRREVLGHRSFTFPILCKFVKVLPHRITALSTAVICKSGVSYSFAQAPKRPRQSQLHATDKGQELFPVKGTTAEKEHTTEIIVAADIGKIDKSFHLVRGFTLAIQKSEGVIFFTFPSIWEQIDVQATIILDLSAYSSGLRVKSCLLITLIKVK